ncbi:O-antigen ligase family protein [Ectothiorhodospiraceae bacterium 2226]|nr:O-antigen ligase family protein [Ectothiorhodospiraceae bacterium 2226]
MIVAPHLTWAPAWLSDHNAQRLLQIAVLSIIALAVLLSPRLRNDWLRACVTLPPSARWLLLAALIAGIISSAVAPSPRHAFLDVALHVLIFGLVIAVAQARRALGGRADVLILSLLTLSVALYLVRFVSGYLAVLMVGEPLPVRELFSGFSNVRSFNHYLTWLLPLLAAAAGLRTLPRGAVLTLLGGCWMLLLATDSRGGLLAVGAGAVFVFACFGRAAAPWLVLQFKAALAGAVAYGVMFYWLLPASGGIAERLAHVTEDPARLALWQVAVRMIVDNPALGVGPMHFAYYPNGIAAGPHNSVLQWTSEWGAPATLALLIVLFWGMYAWCRQVRSAADVGQTDGVTAVRIGLTASMATAAAHSLVSGITGSPVSQLLAVLVVGWAIGIYSFASHEAPRHSHSLGTHLLFATAALLTLLLLWRGAVPDLEAWRREQLSGQDVPRSSATRLRYEPRFWLQGLIGDAPYDETQAVATPPDRH